MDRILIQLLLYFAARDVHKRHARGERFLFGKTLLQCILLACLVICGLCLLCLIF